MASQSTMPVQRAGQRAERALDAREPAGGGAHDHAREREQEQQRRDVAQQHVLDHVRGEEVVLAEAVERGDQRGQQREHPAGERRRLSESRAAAAGLAPGRPEAPDVDPDQERQRRQHGGVGEPVELRVALRCNSDTHAIVASARPPVGRPPPGSTDAHPARGARGASALLGLFRGRPRAAVRSVARARAGCGACRRTSSTSPACPASPPVAYEGPARALVRALKFRAALAVAGLHGGGHRGHRARRPLRRSGARAGPARALPRAQPRLQPGARARARTRPAHRLHGRRVPPAPRRAGHPGRPRPRRAHARPGGLHARRRRRRAGRPGGRWWTTWPPPEPPSRPARSALRGAGCEPVLAVTYARTLGRL